MADLKKCDKLQEFFKHHCKATHYAFQIRKCRSPECEYCTQNPPKLQRELHFMPDSVIAPNVDGEKCQEFEDVYGKETTDDDFPSKKAMTATAAADVTHKDTLIAGKVIKIYFISDPLSGP